MPFDSEEKRSDFDIWAEEYEDDDKELKRQKKLELKEKKKAEKRALKLAKAGAAKDIDTEESEDKKDSEAFKDVSEDAKKEVSKGDATGKEDSSEDKETVSSSDSVDDIDEYYDEHAKDYKREKKKKDKDEINIVKELFNLIIYIGIIIIICYCIITFVGQRTTVHGHSMENTLQDGDNLWIDKLSYQFGDPKRFDIVVFPYQGQDVYYIKRVIGLPGEKVQITPDGNILINDEVLMESYGREIIADSGTASEPRVLGEDEYFVLGDNRNDSRDSRWADVGDINKKDIIGKAVLRLSPFKKFGKIN
ncbi:MAG: signal peptidase I [Eubacterium sp.]|nr:signal peptidase I [Eubacterium sp.]